MGNVNDREGNGQASGPFDRAEEGRGLETRTRPTTGGSRLQNVESEIAWALRGKVQWQGHQSQSKITERSRVPL